ncbi:MAG: response regulator transcription factor [Bellilinea sp.]
MVESQPALDTLRVALLAPTGAIRAGLRVLLQSSERVEILRETNDPQDLAGGLEMDVLVIHAASRPSGDWLEHVAGAAVLLLIADRMDGEQPFPAGLWKRPLGVLPLDVEAQTLHAALDALAQGLSVAPPAWLNRLPGNAGVNGTGTETQPGLEALTPREAEVLNVLAQGLTNKQIAHSLGISEHTVKYHISSIYSKLGAMNRAEAVRVGARRGWIAI